MRVGKNPLDFTGSICLVDPLQSSGRRARAWARTGGPVGLAQARTWHRQPMTSNVEQQQLLDWQRRDATLWCIL
jgi:hypothetical protein